LSPLSRGGGGRLSAGMAYQQRSYNVGSSDAGSESASLVDQHIAARRRGMAATSAVSAFGGSSPYQQRQPPAPQPQASPYRPSATQPPQQQYAQQYGQQQPQMMATQQYGQQMQQQEQQEQQQVIMQQQAQQAQAADISQQERVKKAMDKKAAAQLHAEDSKWQGEIGKVAKHTAFVHERFVKLAGGQLQFCDAVKNGRNPSDAKPRRTDYIESIKSVEWSGCMLRTSVEDFRLYERPDASPPANFTALMKGIRAAVDMKQRDDGIVTSFNPSDVSGCAVVSRLFNGEVLFKPDAGASQEESNLEMKRLSIGVMIVKQQLYRNSISWKGWVLKQMKQTKLFRPRWLVVEQGTMRFYTKPSEVPTGRPRKVISLDGIRSLELDQVTIVTPYDSYKLKTPQRSPDNLTGLVTVIEHQKAASNAEAEGDAELMRHLPHDDGGRGGAGGSSRAGGSRAGGSQAGGWGGGRY